MRRFNSAAKHYESGERLGRAVLNHWCDYCVPYRRQRQKVCFDITYFDAVAADLELRLRAAFKKKQATAKSALVAGPISAPITLLKECGCRELGPPQVAWTNIWSRDHNFASLVRWQSFARFTHNENIGPRRRAPHW